MKIILWPYSKKQKSMIMKDGIANNVYMVFHNPGRVTEQFEFINGDMREYIPSFEAAKAKFENFEGTLNVFYNTDIERSYTKVTNILKKNKIKYEESKSDYPL